MVAEAVRALGGLDILVNSVGAAKSGAFLALGEADWAESLALKPMGQIRVTREALAVPVEPAACAVILIKAASLYAIGWLARRRVPHAESLRRRMVVL